MCWGSWCNKLSISRTCVHHRYKTVLLYGRKFLVVHWRTLFSCLCVYGWKLSYCNHLSFTSIPGRWRSLLFLKTMKFLISDRAHAQHLWVYPVFQSSHWRYSVKIVFLKISKYHRKTSVLKSLFNKVSGAESCTFIKKKLQHRYFSCEIWETFKNIYFEEHLRTTASMFFVFVKLMLAPTNYNILINSS